MNSEDKSEPPSLRLGVVVLAAGQGTRMRSPLPKVLHPVAGRPMIQHVLGLAGRLNAAETVVVVAPGNPELREALGNVTIVEQGEQLGTGHAVLQARPALAGRTDRVLVLYGDTPLVQPETAQRLVDALGRGPVAILTARLADPGGYGRIVRDPADGAVLRIVEESDADTATRTIDEVNSGLMAFEAAWLWEQLPRLLASAKGEYYLTDLVQVAIRDGRSIGAVQADDPLEISGINSQRQLAAANRAAWDRETERLMALGVTVLDPATTYVEPGVEVAPGTIIHPNTHLHGTTRIAERCQIGPGSVVIDSVIGARSWVWASVVEQSVLESDVQVGPFSHLRPGCYVESEVRLGNYAEAKASRIGRGTQVHHFSYLGDADIGRGVNIGAGTITVNYDGRAKHRTVIGDGAFIGSDTMLRAPLRIGAGARTGTGSVVTHDVPEGGTVVGVPARPYPTRSTAAEGEAGLKDGD